MITELHCHTTASDGVLTPAQLVELALSKGVEILSITDHDTTAAYPEALRAAQGQLELWPGIEINCEETPPPGRGRPPVTPPGKRVDVHLLGYFIDVEHPELLKSLATVREARATRVHRMVQILGDLGLDLRLEEALAESTGPSLGRPHVARAMVKKGLVADVNQAFDRYLASGQPAYVPRASLQPVEAIQLIRRAGGLPSLAHPGLMKADDLIPGYVEAGLQGLEVYYGKHSPEQVEAYEQLARKHGLLMTGGSDFHGPGHGHPLGEVSLPEPALRALREVATRC